MSPVLIFLVMEGTLMSPDAYQQRLEGLISASTQGEKFRLFMRYFSFALAVSVLLLYTLLESDYQALQDQKRAHELQHIDTLTTLISSDIDVLNSDLATLVGSLSLRQYLESPTQGSKLQLATRLKQFLEYRRVYDQIRLIDVTGREIIRINNRRGQGVIVPEAQLQDKSDRYYFQNSVNLEPGDIYMSPMDLNVEGGQIEVPYKPVIRVATPIFKPGGERWGVLVLNYLADRILDRVAQLDRQTDTRLQLLNSDGYWLYHRSADLRWGFMRGLDEARFPEAKPFSWHQMVEKPDGRDKSVEAGLGHVYRWLMPAEWMNNQDHPLATSVRWLLISEFPAPKRFSAKYLAAEPENLLLSVCLLGLMGVLAWFYSVHRLGKLRLRSMNQLAFLCMEQNPAAVMITNKQGEIIYVNALFSEMTGYSFEDVRGKKTSVLKSGNTSPEVYESLWTAISRGKFWAGDLLNCRADGTQFWARLSISPIFNSDDEVTHYLCVEEDITERVEAEKKLQYLATHDALTNLENRRSIIQSLNDELVRSMRYKHPISVLLMDIDNFKSLNDTLGHLAGDDILNEFGRRLDAQARQSDRVGRFGGEEFLVVLPETGEQEALQVAERMFQAISSEPFQAQGQSIPVTVSVGCATNTDVRDVEVDLTGLLQAADERMYAAKEHGKNQIRHEPS